MSEAAEKQEGQKTVVAFVAGLLIGGLLVWVFSGPGDHSDQDHKHQDDKEESTEMTDGDTGNESLPNTNEDSAGETSSVPEMVTGDGEIEVTNQPAGNSVTIAGATFPNDEGWIAVRTYQNDQLGNILGAARFSKEQGLVPEEVPLLAPTVAGRTYAVVFFTEDGDREFNLAGDVQVEGVWNTFTAQ